MPRHSMLPAVLLALSTLAPMTDAEAQASRLTVEYLGNEGVLVTAGTSSVLIDALFGDGLPEYPVVPPVLRDSLERALGRFAEVDLVLVTHRHNDHFHAGAVARHLSANPEARLVAPAEIVALVRQAGWDEPSRTTPILPDSMRPGGWTGAGVVVEGHAIPHARVQHLVWVVEVGGRRLMHAGDAEPSPAQLQRASGAGVDLLLTPWWITIGTRAPERIAATRARQVAAFHVGHSDDLSAVPATIRTLRRPGESITLP